MDAVESGRVTADRLNESVKRILELKNRAGLFRRRTVPLEEIPAVVGRQEFQESANDIAARSLTLVRAGPIVAWQDGHYSLRRGNQPHHWQYSDWRASGVGRYGQPVSPLSRIRIRSLRFGQGGDQG